MEDTLFAVLFCGACMFCLDHLGLWRDVILKTVGSDLYTHHFLITFVVNNAAFFPFALFLARYDLRNPEGEVQALIDYFAYNNCHHKFDTVASDFEVLL